MINIEYDFFFISSTVFYKLIIIIVMSCLLRHILNQSIFFEYRTRLLNIAFAEDCRRHEIIPRLCMCRGIAHFMFDFDKRNSKY